MEETAKWKLSMGCHRGTLTSRDSEVPFYGSYEECMEEYRTTKKRYHSIGYCVWFAKVTDPEGNVKFRDSGEPYH